MRATFLLLISTALHAGEPVLVPPQDDKLLMLDTRVIEQTENARLVLGTAEKAAENPLLPSDQPWENATNNYYPNVTWDAEAKLWKMWYKDVLADKDVIALMDGPSTVHEVGWYLLYATSKDGLKWEKPALGLHKFAGSGANNIVARDCPNVGVFKDLHDADPARRYKMVSDVGLGKPQVRFSADGIHWSEALAAHGFGGIAKGPIPLDQALKYAAQIADAPTAPTSPIATPRDWRAPHAACCAARRWRVTSAPKWAA